MTGPSTDAARLAEEYVRRGGKRRAKLDDNIVSTRLWEDEPKDASEFWRDDIETLSEVSGWIGCSTAPAMRARWAGKRYAPKIATSSNLKDVALSQISPWLNNRTRELSAAK
jgi:hypothetical protein